MDATGNARKSGVCLISGWDTTVVTNRGICAVSWSNPSQLEAPVSVPVRGMDMSANDS